MKREVTREILRGVPIGAEDAARLVLEFIEELGDMGGRDEKRSVNAIVATGDEKWREAGDEGRRNGEF